MEDEMGIENPDCDGSFEFESDHLALRGNKDYSVLLNYIVKLEVQKIKAIKDIEELAEQKKTALEDPFKFLEDLQKGNIVFPLRQTVPGPPPIDWANYGAEDIMELVDIKPELNPDNDRFLVRGRKFTNSKPETFNQLWSCEEQVRLEELLEVYPEEAVEANRYKKIGQALGTRTQVQVMSRIQKYFAKLAKAGLPIPGRQPKKIAKDRNKANFYKKSTFFPQLHVPVKMGEPLDNMAVPLDNNITQASIVNQNKQNKKKYYLELLAQAKDQRQMDEQCPIWQTNTVCVACQKSGFLGARWTDHAGTDYCTDCVVELLPLDKLTPIRRI